MAHILLHNDDYCSTMQRKRQRITEIAHDTRNCDKKWSSFRQHLEFKKLFNYRKTFWLIVLDTWVFSGVENSFLVFFHSVVFFLVDCSVVQATEPFPPQEKNKAESEYELPSYQATDVNFARKFNESLVLLTNWRQRSLININRWINTHKDEEVKDEHEILYAAEAVPLHAGPSCWSLSKTLGGKSMTCKWPRPEEITLTNDSQSEHCVHLPLQTHY